MWNSETRTNVNLIDNNINISYIVTITEEESIKISLGGLIIVNSAIHLIFLFIIVKI